MGRLFGTDGVRGIANGMLTCDLAFKLGQAGAFVLTSQVHKARILIGRDTRISGNMLEAAMVAGICSVGAEAVVAGVIPTSGVAFLTRDYEADAGVVISASHNSVEYNGIKFFNSEGKKLPDEVEDRIERIILDGSEEIKLQTGINIGRKVSAAKGLAEYKEFLISAADTNLRGLKIVLDCAHGAASFVGPRSFTELGAEVIPYYNTPDGTNINDYCGSTYPQKLTQLVAELGADMGFAFDGDADRLIAVDEAHCISQWGPAFRPEYEDLARLRDIFPGVPIAALTATADQVTREDISQRLFAGAVDGFVLGFDRPNIRVSVELKNDWKRQLVEFVKRHDGASGIVYCLSRKKTEETAALLRDAGVRALPYHAGM
ncbi:MAG: hypothetical protein HN948_00285, partial [Clostridia bacterium]|nr:hypothetical protein [Clostridia bacterium]